MGSQVMLPIGRGYCGFEEEKVLLLFKQQYTDEIHRVAYWCWGAVRTIVFVDINTSMFYLAEHKLSDNKINNSICQYTQSLKEKIELPSVKLENGLWVYV